VINDFGVLITDFGNVTTEAARDPVGAIVEVR
jgi:hypothetical protein